ncbi:CzcE family metal-binding protein [uncultured Massilia sp.]|uniref:CzcE family metal-binding protein n=1 Tax=uncultured Massilia sp. TaxID=169973 RepID=UPI0025E7D48A|nr:CzcE family metal-binding protein [uncultured Massilia sp.]
MNMKTTLLFPVMLPVLLATTLAAGAAEQPLDFAGNAVPRETRADQVIVITAATRHVNVTGGSVVRFVVGDRSFTWNFQNGVAHVVPFDLARIAPPGLVDHRVTTYVSDNPLYQNN